MTGGEVVVTGSKERLAVALTETKKGTSLEVPKSVLGWLANSDSPGNWELRLCIG